MSDPSLRMATLLAMFVLADTLVTVLVGFRPILTVPFVIGLVVVGVAAARRARRGHPAERLPRGSRWVVVLVALALLIPVVWLPVPLDTDGQGFGHLALAVREGGTLTTLAPWRPGISYLYAPGALVLLARVSSLVPWLAMSEVMLWVGHAAGLLFVCVAGACGAELGASFERQHGPEVSGDAPTRRWRAAATVAAAGSVGYWTALIDSHYTSTLALTFVVAWMAWWLRALRTFDRGAVVASGCVLAAVVATHQDTAIIVALGGAPLVFAAASEAGRGRRVRAVGVAAACVVTAAVVLGPWLVHIGALLASGIASPFEPNTRYWRQAVLFHGGIWTLAALVALVIWRRRPLAWACAAWIALVFDFAMTGGIERLIPWLAAPIVRFDYPFSLAWHGPIVPYFLLGTALLAWLDARFRTRLADWPGRRLGMATAAGLIVVGATLPLLADWTRPHVSWHGAFATANDVAALRWIRAETSRSARLLNYPGDYTRLRDWEGHWTPVIAERDAVYFRMQPFFLPGASLDAAYSEQRDLLAFWRDPADVRHAERLQAAAIDFVVVPEVTNDAAAAAAWRGAPPALLDAVRSRPADAPYLRRVFSAGGAEVYAVDVRVP